jgi:cellulose synthase/poly-beta-1,6-N-acetylglucosamine synthase-like glycosyltransferase
VFGKFSREKIKLHIFLTIALGIPALLWAIQSIRAGIGMTKLPRVERFAPLDKSKCPRVSIMFAARDEAEKLSPALASLLALDYPDYEVIAVDDRSSDATGRIMEEFAARDSRLRVTHISDLPPGWLGKPHALNSAYQLATAPWLVFTDADVIFAPDSLSRVMTLATTQQVDHLALMTQMTMVGFWERVVMTYFGLGFTLGTEPWQASNPKSSKFTGIGAFQLMRRTVYDAVDGHRKLAMEVIEDMKMGKLVKKAGYRSQAGYAAQHIKVRWQAGLGNLVRGTTKNFFAAAYFNLPLVCVQIFGIFLMSVFPWIALAWLLIAKSFGLPLLFAGVAVGIALCVHVALSFGAKASPLYGLSHPIGALIFMWMLTRSTVITLSRGGIVWRDTFYPLADLRRGMV